MIEARIRISLQSDMCVSDGSIYNSSIDTDVCKDRFGFPFIPAKRIRGCLREQALELAEWGENIDPDELFGKEGAAQNRGRVRIGNAYLENYKELRRQVNDHRESLLMHPQNILNHYSYLRTQTSLSYETGIADDTSLRTMRVMKKGLVFFADVEISSDDAEKQLEECCLTLRHMGIARTRGLGEVSVSLIRGKDAAKDGLTAQNAEDDCAGMENETTQENASRLDYTITLEEPVICKSLDGGEAHTQDFIEGSKILGLIAGYLRKHDIDYQSFMNLGELRCTNAYITDRGARRYVEVPGFLYEIKNDKTHYINKLAYQKGTEERQLSQMKHAYVCAEVGAGREITGLWKTQVTTEESYHHRRPENKGIGRAHDEGENAAFYQMEAISAGQTFAGSIIGSPEQIHLCLEALMASPITYLGYSRSSEYGKVTIRVRQVSAGSQATVDIQEGGNFVVLLCAPAIVYSENAMASTDPEILRDEIKAELGLPDIRPAVYADLQKSVVEDRDVEDREDGKGAENAKNSSHPVLFMRYTSLGGFNTTWNSFKPVIPAFDKGTALVFHTESALSVPVRSFIGDRRREGYGEIRILPLSGREQYEGDIIKDTDDSGKEEIDLCQEENDSLTCCLSRELFLSFVRSQAVEHAANMKTVSKAVVNNMLMMTREQDSLEKVRKQADRRWRGKSAGAKEEKYQEAYRTLKTVEDQYKGLPSAFAEQFRLQNFEEKLTGGQKEQMEMEYLAAFLTHMKYRLREKEAEE